MAENGPTGLFAVLHTSNVLESRLEARLSDVGLSLAKLAALHQLTAAGESLPLGQLAERLACVKSKQLVDRLEADGLVNRTADPNDRRSRIAVLTPAGRTAYSKGSEIQKQTELELFGVLTPTESETLHELLAKLQH
jgi:DNA-binding MarR family transcriptional regulator